MSDESRIHVTVNGVLREEVVPHRITLVDFLRHTLRLTGTHVGCEHGVCGACTVLVDGRAVRSCLMLAVQANLSQVQTVEGLASGPILHTLQAAFIESNALQCGFCTPGILMTLLDVLRTDPMQTDESIRDALSGNLCRCTGYQTIVDAALLAARRLRADRQNVIT